MKQHMRSILILSVVFAILNLIGCGGSSTSPSSQPQIIQGSISTDTGLGIKVVPFSTTKAGTLSSSVNWSNTTNDFDTYLINGTCSVGQLLLGASGCEYTDAIAEDISHNKPAVFTSAVSVGAYSLVMAYLGLADDTATYRIEVN
jgi:hypothetical protein